MSANASPAWEVSPEVAARTEYDAVVVGSGVSGAIVALELATEGFRILVMEAGSGSDITIADYDENVRRFYQAVSKDNNSAYAGNLNAPMPRSPDARKLAPGEVNADGYLVQNGPYEMDSTYTRVLGGTTRHWEAKALRMVPDDFAMRSLFGCGRDWPVGYDDLAPYYAKAERELGVSGDVEDQLYAGLRFEPGYVYPMKKMPFSYLDQAIARDLDGMEVAIDGQTYPIRVRSTPQARNGIPNPDYDGGRGYRPMGAVSLHQAEMGERCQGNTNCVPICPVQAKYDARRTLFKALQTGRVHLLAQTVAGNVEVDPATGRIVGIGFKTYRDSYAPDHVAGTARGRLYVLAANAVENARLMRASGLDGRGDLVGRNLMDHAYLLTWALMPELIGAMRGPLCTGGIEDLRTGAFRRRQAAFRYSIHNDGWGWATGAPYTDLAALVDHENRIGVGLRRSLVDRVARQVLIDCMIEVLPEEGNRITVDPAHTDQLGNLRPVLSYTIPAYTMEGAAFGRRLARRIYQTLGAEEHTAYDSSDYGWVEHGGEGFLIRGGNHWAGTHIMGLSASNSVVDPRQRSWEHGNLYLVGAGSMPSIGTANTTLTLAALCLISTEQMARDLRQAAAPVAAGVDA